MEKSQIIKRALSQIDKDVAQEIKDHEILMKNLMIDLGLTEGRVFYEIINKINEEGNRHSRKMLDLERSKNTVLSLEV